MLTQCLTILKDAVRLLRSQVLFYVSLVISALCGLLLLSTGFSETGMFTLFGLAEVEHANLYQGSDWSEAAYLSLFQSFGINIWLSRGAVLLGLISTCTLFPSYQRASRVGVELAKPVGRWTFFLVRYVGGLSFMLAQLLVFVSLVWLGMGLQLSLWSWHIWLTVPYILAAFSFIYAVQVFMGVWTKSAMMSFLSAILVWAMTLAAGSVDFFMWIYQEGVRDRLGQATELVAAREINEQQDLLIDGGSSSGADLLGEPDEDTLSSQPPSSDVGSFTPAKPSGSATAGSGSTGSAGALGITSGQSLSGYNQDDVVRLSQQLERAERNRMVTQTIYGFFPKNETTAKLVGRRLEQDLVGKPVGWMMLTAVFFEGMGKSPKDADGSSMFETGAISDDELELASDADPYNRNSALFTIGTSLLVEIVLVAAAGFIFSRRDF